MPARRPRILWPAILLVIAAAALSWWMLRPLPAVHEHRARRVAIPAPSPTEAAPTAAATPTPTPQVATHAPGARLAIIIDDAGQWLQIEREFIALPIPLTMSVLPDVRYSHLIASETAAAGKGVMLHLPMEPISHINPGPGKITTEMTDTQISDQVDADLNDVPLAQGVNNHEGSKATADPRVMRDVAAVIAQHRDLFFIDSMTSAHSIAAEAARSAGVPAARRDVFLDDVNEVPYVEGQLETAGKLALQNGQAIAIGHPRPATFAALRAMIPRLQNEGVTFVLVRDLVRE
jgi:polysaccharide deacetylase 2 family uncharacterized protein YibQ